MTEAANPSPAKVTREQLYEMVWREPLMKVADRFGILPYDLAEICRKHDVPRPASGHWQKVSAGKPLNQPTLPDRPYAALTIVISPRIKETEQAIDPRALELMDRAQAALQRNPVQDHVDRPHSIIRGWKQDHARRTAEARRDRTGWGATAPAPYSDIESRRHRILESIFRTMDAIGAKVREGEKGALLISMLGENIEFQVRERLRQVRRAPNSQESRWHSAGHLVTELQGTGRLLFAVKTYVPDWGSREWEEDEKRPLEALLPEIISLLPQIAVRLADRTKRREEERQESQRREAERYERQQLAKQQAARVDAFLSLSDQARRIEDAKAFLQRLREMGRAEAMVGDRSVSEWIQWAENFISASDPLIAGPEGVFQRIASVSKPY